MFFRVWFYLGKLMILLFGLVVLEFFMPRSWWPAGPQVAKVIFFVQAIFAVVFGIWGCVGIWSACPRCGTRGLWFHYGGSGIGLDCQRCGGVHGDLLWDWRLHVTAPATTTTAVHEDATDTPETP